ncbi:MAG: hypothetical protein OEZ39_15635 [Gammaproteobacteria bacterium]|nr:hypothetical protein [Gammaproteobacteria bacterium]MDH5653288.1 hypothetical protein [Gammaproteobacteria bacterium]
MIDKVFSLIGQLPPLSNEKNPNIAAALAFFFGFIGMIIYGMSFIDIIIGISIAILAGLSLGPVDPILGYLAGMLVAAIYSYFRVLTSNRKLTGK